MKTEIETEINVYINILTNNYLHKFTTLLRFCNRKWSWQAWIL